MGPRMVPQRVGAYMPDTDEITEKLSADEPLTSPADDRLGYAPCARRLADSIQSTRPPQGLTNAAFA